MVEEAELLIAVMIFDTANVMINLLFPRILNLNVALDNGDSQHRLV